MGILKELERRNVYRVGIAYVAVAWLVLQVADVLIGNIDAPEWLFEAILTLLALGFPVALFLAWEPATAAHCLRRLSAHR